ncbi:hypothetical protein FOCC_FOCC015663 [Frankliniella occidentalis]|nr:hypothetical protein FOCC_FOCC015663 [Frankliniella occidentalis]
MAWLSTQPPPGCERAEGQLPAVRKPHGKENETGSDRNWPGAPTSTTAKKFSFIQRALSFTESFDSGSITNEELNNDEQDSNSKEDGANDMERTLSIESDICDSGEYTRIHKTFWSSFVKNMICKHCKANQMSIKVTEEHGFVKKLQVTCKGCQEILSNLYTSPRTVDSASSRPPFALNRKMCEVFINTGTAVRKAHEDVDPSLEGEAVLDLAVSFDGSWPKRGHTSLVGFGAVIDIFTGLVIDYEILSKYCHMCSLHANQLGEDSAEYVEWFEQHIISGDCGKNYDGSSPAMEKEVAEILWKRSEEECKMRYTVMLSDGDGKTFDHLQSLDIYNGITLVKEECTNHVEKRLGTALRNVVDTEKKRGVTLGGRGPGTLKADTIDKLQKYYRLAIQKNAPDVPKMKKAVMATIYHVSSTDSKPNHNFCPQGKNSWCFYNKAKAEKRQPKSHTAMSLVITKQVFDKILPSYQRLANEELLERCARVGTQNSNESLHHVIWNRCPKTLFFSLKRYQLGITLGVGEFNMGCKTILEMKADLRNEEVTEAAMKIAERKDKKRLRKSEEQDQVVAKRARKKSNKKKKNKEAAKKKKEGVTYAPGGF